MIFVAPMWWIARRTLFGGNKAKFTDSVWIVSLGVILGAFVGALMSGIVSVLIQFIIWLYLIKRFFDWGWFTALAISIAAVNISTIIVMVLGLLRLVMFRLF